MRLATWEGDRTPAAPGITGATCPNCQAPVRAKCGQQVAWHWAHKSADCDSWAEPDNTWHSAWQARFPVAQCEITMGRHRADIVTNGGVVEVQHSHLSTAEIREREAFYGSRSPRGRLCWIFDATDAYSSGRLDLRTKPGRPPGWRSFRWRHARRSLGACRALVYLDLGTAALRLGSIYTEAPVGGWGYLMDHAAVIREVSGCLAGTVTTP